MRQVISTGLAGCIMIFTMAACGTAAAPSPAVEVFATQTPAAPATAPVTSEALPARTARLPADLELSGQLIFTEGSRGIFALDLASGSVTSLFAPPSQGYVASAAVSPDGSQIVMAYAQPPPDGLVQAGLTDLYVLPVDGSADSQIILDAAGQELYTWPTWSSDGHTIYFGHTMGMPDPSADDSGMRLERITFPGGESEEVVRNAFSPDISPDGTRIVYIARSSSGDDLVIANIDGSEPFSPLPPGMFGAVDAPLFTADGSAVVFSAAGSADPPPDGTWLYDLFGIEVARAHETPSDLWQVSVAGGAPLQLTRIADFGLYPTFSPDGSYMALLRASGLYIMKPDGTGLVQILGPGPSGTIQWIP